VGEAEEHLSAIGRGSDVGQFFNFVAGLAERTALGSIREELRDRALRGLAAQIRREVSPGSAPGRAVSDYLGREGTWPAPLVRDADYAVKALTRAAPPAPRPSRVGNAPRRTRIARGLVTAACAAGGGNAIFLGFEEGGVFCYRPDRNEVQLVAAYDLPVASLA